tara:strand:- start:131 stop:664 length:534 start_codon:yes stop_codon:yes gene_type:complete
LGSNFKSQILNKYLSIFSFLIIPILFLWNPSWFSLMGSQPYWPIFWLIPWAVMNGSFETMVVGFLIGLILDILNNDFYTQIPGLMITGFWFGRVAYRSKINLSALQYGLIASLGSLICGLIYFSQILLNLFFSNSTFFLFAYAGKNIFAQVLLTGLLAPVFCSWLYLLFNRRDKLKL